MNESEIRSRLRMAIGETTYPPALRDRVAGRLNRPSHREHSTLVSLVAAILALAIIATLVFVRVQALPRVTPAATPTTRVSPPAQENPFNGPPLVSTSHLPAADLAAALFNPSTAALVTPMNLSATSNGRVVTLIGAYADALRMVVFFRTVPPVGLPRVLFSDGYGSMNAGGSSGDTSFGDSFNAVDTGPRAGPDGVAHLTVVLNDFAQGVGGASTAGPWTFSFAMKVSAPTPLTLTPPPGKVGTWKFNVETFEATPTVIQLKGSIDGATVSDVSEQTITIADGNGSPVNMLASGAGGLAAGPLPVDASWLRPPTGGVFTLRISGGGGTYAGRFSIPSVPVATSVKGRPILPADFPASSESLRIDGPFSASITHGYPTQCGSGVGSSGTLFAFATYFQVQDHWYLITFSTDPARQQYRGPGTYPGRAILYPYAAYGADPIFAGTVDLTIASDTRPDSGSVTGDLHWVGSAAGASDITLSGNWNCTPSSQLGPG
jgi:hypothetical protein